MFVINYWDFLVFSFSWHTNGLEAGGEHRQQTFSPQREYEPSSYDCMNKQNQPNKKKTIPRTLSSRTRPPTGLQSPSLWKIWDWGTEIPCKGTTSKLQWKINSCRSRPFGLYSLFSGNLKLFSSKRRENWNEMFTSDIYEGLHLYPAFYVRDSCCLRNLC